MCFPLLGKAQSLQVCPQCPISTIAQAVAIAKKGDTIEVQKGTYPENNILLDKPLTLIGSMASSREVFSKYRPIALPLRASAWPTFLSKLQKNKLLYS